MSQGLGKFGSGVRKNVTQAQGQKGSQGQEQAGRDSMTHVAYGKWRTPLDRHCDINGRE